MILHKHVIIYMRILIRGVLIFAALFDISVDWLKKSKILYTLTLVITSIEH